MSAFPVTLGRLGFGKPAKGKAKKKARKRSRAKAVSAEYSMLLTATLCLLALGAVMVFSASSTTRILQNGGLSDSAFYLKRTLIFGTVGLVVMHLVARHGLIAIRRLTPALVAVSLFLLVAVLGIGIGTAVKAVTGSTPGDSSAIAIGVGPGRAHVGVRGAGRRGRHQRRPSGQAPHPGPGPGGWRSTDRQPHRQLIATLVETCADDMLRLTGKAGDVHSSLP